MNQYLANMTSNDAVILFAGTNDVSCESCSNQILFQINNLLQKSSNRTKLIIIGLPLKRHQPHLNPEILNIKEQIQKSVAKFSHVTFLSLNSVFQPYFYTRFGLHFNIFGKKHIANFLLNIILPPLIGIESQQRISVHITCRPKLSSVSNFIYKPDHYMKNSTSQSFETTNHFYTHK